MNNEHEHYYECVAKVGHLPKLRYGYGIAMPVVIGHSGNTPTIGAHFWMPPWRRAEVYGEDAPKLPDVGFLPTREL